MDIYIGTKNGQRQGPYDPDEIWKRIMDERYDGCELAWHEGLDNWVLLEEAQNNFPSPINLEKPAGSQKIFVNHRQEFNAKSKVDLVTALNSRYPGKVFIDKIIHGGDDWHEVIMEEVQLSRAMVSLIGPRWIEQFKTERDEDVCRQEIITAASCDPPVDIIPVLLDGAKMPEDDELNKKGVDNLVGLQYIEIHGDNFANGLEVLYESIDKALNKTSKQDSTATPTSGIPLTNSAAAIHSIGLYGADKELWATMGSAGTRSRGLYVPADQAPFKMSRSKLDSFLKCPRCFYLDRRLGIRPPSGPVFTLNMAVDQLLKKEFDSCRERQEPHALLEEHNINAVPWSGLTEHEDWRNNFKGIQYLHQPTNLLLFGAVDDIWINKQDELIVVDYKATSKSRPIHTTEDIGGWYEAYRRQLEVYQWLLRRNGQTVSDTAYWVYANADKAGETLAEQLRFKMTVVKAQADDGWVDEVLQSAHTCLQSDALPEPDLDCDSCKYLAAISAIH